MTTTVKKWRKPKKVSTLPKRPKILKKDKVIPKDYHISGLKIEEVKYDDVHYHYVRVMITHNDYLTNPELFEAKDVMNDETYYNKKLRAKYQKDIAVMAFSLSKEQIIFKEE